MPKQSKVRTCLWFETGGKEAVELYVSLLPDSIIENEYTPPGGAEPLHLEFTLAGAPYQAINGGPHFKHSPAASISVMTEDQTETDKLWSALIADGGEESQCGWLVDRFGLSWQIVPKALMTAVTAKDEATAERARQAMYKMRKIDIAAIEKAFNG
ncbi:VOC family protein [Hyphococcus flavus]|uniref:VOC family protein n=1 Tax=Hyphococcus flavus TaxID=1866326 RepID=A0AAE9ZCC4_9PROT|nr:VOC family protein [Hyphococcus flavus]WDI32288.1 VOC family protein [Hyphococcus flavus]